MTKFKKHGLVAALIFFGSSLLPSSSCVAQSFLATGTYSGEAFWQETFIQNFMVVGQSSGEGSATFTFAFYGENQALVTYEGPPFSFFEAPGYIGQFGPTSASGSIQVLGQGPFAAEFSATYESILPNGQIVVGDGGASYDLSGTSVNPFSGSGVDYSLHFGSGGVPEPSSIVLATSAVLMIVIFAWIRSFGPRRWFRPS